MKKRFASLLAWLYGLVVRLSQWSYRILPFRIRKVQARVISVGNITWGGTGKTPLVIKLAQEMTAHYGRKVAVLTRGYGDDEVQEMRKKLQDIPLLVGRDRVKTAREAVEKHGAQYLILDDGFQHLRLHRDLDVVNINSTQPFGPGGLIPDGTLREPLSSLARADVFILTKSNIGSKNVAWIRQKIEQIKPKAAIYEAVHRPVQFADLQQERVGGLHEVRGRKVAVISAIADPYSFEKTVESLGAEIALAARFDDHHEFTREELTDFAAHCRELGCSDVVTTEKDSFRLLPALRQYDFLKGLHFRALQIEFQIQDEDDFVRRCLNR
ncbi:MAG: Tetraacyldisaccharide 4'-kinase [Candidatus Omnitrophica bacterium]|nr:Tetraacyldisaccharide 4'-kinase [Candidatus Omnitrophota bacterium]